MCTHVFLLHSFQDEWLQKEEKLLSGLLHYLNKYQWEVEIQLLSGPNVKLENANIFFLLIIGSMFIWNDENICICDPLKNSMFFFAQNVLG